MLEIRELTATDLPTLKDFAPLEWNVNLSVVFGEHLGEPYFHPIVAELDGVVVGCANGLRHANAGWLGNIIVLPDFRGQGIGKALTESLVKYFQAECVDHQVLIATSMGEPVYRKLGFRISSYYIFFARQNGMASPDTSLGTRPLRPEDEQAVFGLDRTVTGETRAEFLRRYLEHAWVHLAPSGDMDGYYLPRLGTGLVVASNDKAGLALLGRKLSQGSSMSVAPEQNTAAADFLRANGFVETSRAPRMSLGADIDWQPEHVYARGSGFCG